MTSYKLTMNIVSHIKQIYSAAQSIPPCNLFCFPL